MKKFLFFILAVIFIDFCIQLCGNYLIINSKGGDTFKLYKLIHFETPEILVMGSSRALHHYKPNCIKSVLNQDCYNAGIGGCGIVCAYPLFTKINKRHTPKIIIYEVTPMFDTDENDNLKYLGQIRHFFDELNLETMYFMLNKKEYIKCFSAAYRFNSKIFSLIEDYLSISVDSNNGYIPMWGHITKIAQNLHSCNISSKADNFKVNLLDKFCKQAIHSGSKIIFVRSPLYHGAPRTDILPAMEIAKRYNIPFLDYANNAIFLRNNDYFADRVHLNDKGAEAYSVIFSEDLKQLIQRDKTNVSIQPNAL